METWQLLFDIVVLLGLCMIMGGLFARFGQSPLIGYLLAGMLFGGPGSFNIIHSEHAIESIAELGVALLLFSLGLEFAWERLRGLGGRILGAGASQVALTCIVGASASMLLGRSLTESIAIGAMISLSSTACVLRVLMERSEVDSPHGRNTLGILLTQDVAVVPLAILVTILASSGGPSQVVWNVGRILLSAGALILCLYVLLDVVATRALGTLTLERNRELTMLLAVVVGLGSTWMAHTAGVSPSLGAFAAGMFLGSSAFATQIRADISPLRTVLLTLFFGAAGMVANPVWIAQNLVLVLSVSVAILLGKALLIWVILHRFGQPHHVAAATGLCLSQIGEFAFVLGKLAHDNRTLSTEVYLLLVSSTIVTLFTSPFLIPRAVTWGAWLSRRVRHGTILDTNETDSVGHQPDVLIVGFGPAGQLAAEAFIDRCERIDVVDLSRDNVARAARLGFHSHVGDASQADVLEHLQIHAARAVIITIPDQSAALRILLEVRRQAPHAQVIVRSRYHRYYGDFLIAGASAVVGDEEEVGASLGREIRHWVSEQAPTDDDESASMHRESTSDGWVGAP